MKAVQGRIPVFLDGGVRRGTDVFKALALGASGVFVSEFVCGVHAVLFSGNSGLIAIPFAPLNLLHYILNTLTSICVI